MFGPLGVPELLFILALALLIFGPRKLPEIGRTLGKGMSEFRKASNELKRTLNTEVIREEIRQNDPRRILRDAVEEAGDAEPDEKSDQPAGKSGPQAGKSGPQAGKSGPQAGKSGPQADEKPSSPEGTVSRSSASGAPAADEEETSAEPAADTLPSSSTR